MLLQTPTSSINEFYYIDRFDDIFRLALSMKCQFFYVDANIGILYGFYEEQYSIIQTMIPFKVNHSFFFGGVPISGAATKDIINMTKNYFFVKEYPYCLFPENRRADLMNNNLIFDYNHQKFVDRMTGKILEDCLITIKSDDWFKMGKYLINLNRFLDRQYLLEEPITFIDMMENETIFKVISSKISQGAELLTLRTMNDVFSFYVFKSLLGPLTRSDKLDITIRKDRLEPNRFAITFSVYKKKSKLGIPELSDIRVDTHAFMLNLAYL